MTRPSGYSVPESLSVSLQWHRVQLVVNCDTRYIPLVAQTVLETGATALIDCSYAISMVWYRYIMPHKSHIIYFYIITCWRIERVSVQTTPILWEADQRRTPKTSRTPSDLSHCDYNLAYSHPNQDRPSTYQVRMQLQVDKLE